MDPKQLELRGGAVGVLDGVQQAVNAGSTRLRAGHFDEGLVQDADGRFDFGDGNTLRVAMHRSDNLRRKLHGNDAVALGALVAEGVRVRAVWNEAGNNDGVGMVPHDGGFESAVEICLARGDDGVL